jgi:hypothetical protein
LRNEESRDDGVRDLYQLLDWLEHQSRRAAEARVLVSLCRMLIILSLWGSLLLLRWWPSDQDRTALVWAVVLSVYLAVEARLVIHWRRVQNRAPSPSRRIPGLFE